MPKAAPSSATGRPALRRNQACRQCRKRKLKCDAARPHCGTCVKQWQALVSVPAPVGYTHPTEPPCSYDPVEGLPLAPDTDPIEKIRLLEAQIDHLKSKLLESPEHSARSLSPGNRLLNGRASPSLSGSSRLDNDNSPTLHGIALPRASLDMATHRMPTDIMDTGRPESRSEADSPQPFMNLLFSGWNPDLPDPNVLMHLVDIFFKCDPCGSRILHKPSFMASLRLHPKDQGFPHSALLHAICASASRWASHDIVTLADGTRRDPFAEFHASKTRQYIDRTMASGQDIFDVMQACIILSWYFYQEGRWVEVWIFAGFQTRVAIPLRLNYPGTFTTQGNASPGAYLAPPRDMLDLECRRRAWWMTMIFDRIVAVGGWLHSVDERDIGTELPLRNEDFLTIEAHVPSNPQDLASKDVFVWHPPQYTDSFLLLLKSVMLFGKVTDYNVRSNLRSTSPPSKNQDPFHLPGFEDLDKLVCTDFLENIPQGYKQNYGVGDVTTGVDTDLYMVHIIPHAATITLHNPYLDFSNQQSASTARCIQAAREILSAYYILSATSLDITRLHPFVTICWYLAAVVQVQLCKYFIELGDTERESSVWGEINVLRFAMMEYGSRSPIGTRQEKLLQGLMSEIVRMTTQKEPLQVGIPLYPFSHARVFADAQETAAAAGRDDHHIAPLPVSPPYEVMSNQGSPPATARIVSSISSTPMSTMSPDPTLSSWGVETV
ncbi:hypothetical protein PUNSTDRAFT_58483 [Punctularia strigosozonata HHB-11173 SS5]|uniref:uncharacterized protein n=1 Tax=Punctularia strigosozonata (strain HHB-11173) TaxID=741275 RepID=UPI0004418298|nr:uncharacterized protein PUNSTDRAFT_58483 [Punctularia strigosozonata HHB-11173 SS5]EIN14198.1 hypothetical protein PUNSTDRAFT_58483 [Punctularia strigosozonata HHB-11173 SS5]